VRSRITTRRTWAASVGLLSASLVAVTGMPAASPATTTSSDAVTTSSPAAGAAPQVPADWPTYHRDNERTGVQDGLSPVRTPLQQVTSLPLDGAVYASPVVVHGMRIVATEHDSVYEFHGNTIVWRTHLGESVPRSSLPCGDIDPLGITSTPAYDPARTHLS
jgi:hypothetical protein